MVTLNGGRPINIHEVPSAARVPRRTFDILVLKLERNQSKKSHHRQIKKDKIWSNISKISTTEIRYWGVPLIGFIVSSFFFFFPKPFPGTLRDGSHCPSNFESKSLNEKRILACMRILRRQG